MKSDTILKSSYSEALSFQELRVWQDIEEEIKGWIEGIRDNLEKCETPAEVARFQGRIEACRYFLELPRVILQDHEMRRENKEDGKRDKDRSEE